MPDNNPDNTSGQDRIESNNTTPDNANPPSGGNQPPPPNNQQQGETRQGQQGESGMAQRPQAAVGPSVTDIFNREDTKAAMVQLIAVFGSLAVGYAIFSLIALNQLTGGNQGSVSALAGAGIAFFIVVIIILVLPLMGVISGIRVDETLSELDDVLAYGTSSVGSAVGTVTVLVATIIAGQVGSPSQASFTIGDFLPVVIISAIATAIVSAATVYCLRNLGPDATMV